MERVLLWREPCSALVPMVNFHRLWSTTLGPSYGGLFSTTVLVAPDWLGSNSTYRAGQRVVVGPVTDAPVNGMLFMPGPVVPLASLFRCRFSLHLYSRRAAKHVRQPKGILGTIHCLFAPCSMLHASSCILGQQGASGPGNIFWRHLKFFSKAV